MINDPMTTPFSGHQLSLSLSFEELQQLTEENE